MCVIRAAVPTDASGLAEVIAEAQATWRDWAGTAFEPYDVDELTETWRVRPLDEETMALCVEEEGRVVAVAAARPEHRSFEPSDTSSTSAHLSPFYVRPEYHGSGMAQRLHDALLAELAACGFTTVRLFVPLGAVPARRFYTRNQWVETGKRIMFEGLERIEMRRLVSPERYASVVEVKTKVPDRETAEKIAVTLVTERLAACAHVRGPIDSWYWWQGSVETAKEWKVDVVTAAALRDRCTARITELHPYQLPALLVAEMATSAEYAAWAQANVG